MLGSGWSEEEFLAARERTVRGEIKRVEFNWTKAGSLLRQD
jgi:hypothetical protein